MSMDRKALTHSYLCAAVEVNCPYYFRINVYFGSGFQNQLVFKHKFALTNTTEGCCSHVTTSDTNALGRELPNCQITHSYGKSNKAALHGNLANTKQRLNMQHMLNLNCTAEDNFQKSLKNENNRAIFRSIQSLIFALSREQIFQKNLVWSGLCRDTDIKMIGKKWREKAEKPVRGEKRTRAPCAAWSW